jgi:hypothetical protein
MFIAPLPGYTRYNMYVYVESYKRRHYSLYCSYVDPNVELQLNKRHTYIEKFETRLT